MAKGSPCFLGGNEQQQEDRDRFPGSLNRERAVEMFAGSHSERSAFPWGSLGSRTAVSFVRSGPLSKAPCDW